MSKRYTVGGILGRKLKMYGTQNSKGEKRFKGKIQYLVNSVAQRWSQMGKENWPVTGKKTGRQLHIFTGMGSAESQEQNTNLREFRSI